MTSVSLGQGEGGVQTNLHNSNKISARCCCTFPREGNTHGKIERLEEQLRAHQSPFLSHLSHPQQFQKEQVDPLQLKLQQVNGVGQGLIQSAGKNCDVQGLEHDMEEINTRWNTLNKKVGAWGGAAPAPGGSAGRRGSQPGS